MARRRFLSRAAFLTLLVALDALAQSHQHSLFSEESAVLPAGAHAVEVSTSPQVGRVDAYLRLENQARVLLGLSSKVQLGLALDVWTVSQGSPSPTEALAGFVQADVTYQPFRQGPDPFGLSFQLL